ncbi:MAG: SDR family oxidoreductase [Geminicoccaceae bacterium]|nr:SDR family oxidoreductase [Geminicoccaceae bacterium]MCX7629304.1 SDR family oxidoreductase [Geminicoccaceae bacterium]MDW8341869.1 SDR family oxidoreductase [Geminicoccaceae bacterium]
MPSVLVSGASRGIGRGLVARFARAGWTVLACAREPGAIDLEGSGIERFALDVTDPESVARLARALSGRPLDVLINNAGVYGPRETRLGAIDYDAFRAVLETNTLGPVRLTEALLANLRAGERKTVVTLSSIMGSIALATSPGGLLYRTSKAAVNMAMRSIAAELAAEGFTVVVVHPGWVRTDMGGPGATLSVAERAEHLFRLIDRLRPSANGRFFAHDGRELPW